MAISHRVSEELKNASWIRRMFEAGRALKEKVGADNVFDFSLGNPILEPPQAFQDALHDLAQHPPRGIHRYMPNNGFPSTRDAVARVVSAEHGTTLTADDIVMTVGAAGAINGVLRSILDPGDEVIVLAPYFVEYLFYVKNCQGTPIVVETTESFDLDLAAIERSITEKTKAILINTPNNPTGRIYSEAQLHALSQILVEKEARYGTAIYLVYDTPYAKITFDGNANPPLFRTHPNSVIAHSHSKDLGLAGERIGYLAISPLSADRVPLRDAAVFNNRILGFINAPAIIQLALERSITATVDLSQYIRARDRLCEGLSAAGYEFIPPQGSFYLFPKTPIDDVAFIKILQRHNVLVVPGCGFGRPGYMRISFCVELDLIERALTRFALAMNEARA